MDLDAWNDELVLSWIKIFSICWIDDTSSEDFYYCGKLIAWHFFYLQSVLQL